MLIAAAVTTMTAITGITAVESITPVADVVPVVEEAPEAEAATGACYWASTAYVDGVGHTIYGRVAKCTEINSPYLVWGHTLSCTNGTVKVSGWYAPTNTYKAALYCPYPSVPSSTKWRFST